LAHILVNAKLNTLCLTMTMTENYNITYQFIKLADRSYDIELLNGYDCKKLVDNFTNK